MIRMRVIVAIIVLFLAAILPSFHGITESSSKNNVLDYGAVGDGNHDDTNAFMKAWEATCQSSSSSVTYMHVPSNKKFLIHPVYFKGPCKSPTITVEIHGEIIAPTEPSEWKFNDDDDNKAWIHFRHVDGLSVQGGGSGTIHGRGQNWWKLNEQHKKGKKGPAALEISSSKNVQLNDLNFKDNPRMHLILNTLTSVSVSSINIDAPEKSPNTDGIHVTGSKDVIIDSCEIRTGDDCISIVDGTSDLRVSNIICGPGHGISIGSLGKHGAEEKVENVRVSDVVFRKSTNGARIKTWKGGKGHAKHITFERILSQEAYNPIIINQYYCDHEDCNHAQNSAVAISDITFRQVVGTSKDKTAITLRCSDTIPCKDIILDDIYILSRDGENAEAECKSVRGRVQGKIVPHLDSCLS